MAALVSLLMVITISMLVVKVATVALVLTGVSRELARFQARSAFTGTGFATAESEKIVQHPVRRRIVMWLMLMGNAGIVTAMSSLMLGFVGQGAWGTGIWWRLGVLFGGIMVLWLIASSRWVDRRLSRLIAWALKRYTNLEVRDYVGLLHLAGEYAVTENLVQEGEWLAGRCLTDLELSREGVLVLAIVRADGTYLGAPRGQTCIKAGDTVILYGRVPVLQQLDQRRADWRGHVEHAQSVDEQKRVEEKEAADDPAREGAGTAVKGE